MSTADNTVSFYSAPASGADKRKATMGLHFMDLLDSERRFLACLVEHANAKNGRCDPGQSRIAAVTGLSITTIRRSIERLTKRKLIRRKLRGPDQSAMYWINWTVLTDAYRNSFEQGRAPRAPSILAARSRENRHIAANLKTLQGMASDRVNLTDECRRDWRAWLEKVADEGPAGDDPLGGWAYGLLQDPAVCDLLETEDAA